MMASADPEAELAVLGAVIATGGAILDDISLRGSDFTVPLHGNLFDVMTDMHSRGLHIDAVTLSNANPSRAAFVWSLQDHAPFASAGGYYADIVAAHGMHRRLQGVAESLRNLEVGTSSEELLDKALALIDGAAGESRVKVRMVRDALPDLIERLEAKATFEPSPWAALNRAIGGFRPGAVYVVAARPGVGKTVVAAQIAAKLAEVGHVAFSSLEMSEDELVSRLIAERLGIVVKHVKDNLMDQVDWERFAAGRKRLEELRIAIDDRAAVTPADIRAHARAVSRIGKLSGVVVDYMQLMSSPNGKQDRHVQVSEFSRQMKVMAKDFKVPVIALSQLNRLSEERADKTPRLSDLRESGAIEQDADVVLLLRREKTQLGEKLIMDVAKNRHGKTGPVHLTWEGEFSRAVDL